MPIKKKVLEKNRQYLMALLCKGNIVFCSRFAVASYTENVVLLRYMVNEGHKNGQKCKLIITNHQVRASLNVKK